MSEHIHQVVTVKKEDLSDDRSDKSILITDDLLDQILKDVAAHAPDWLDQKGKAKVTLHGVDDRAQSTLISVDVEIAGFNKELLIKSPKVVTYDPEQNDRLLKPVSGPLAKSKLEFDALSAIARHFKTLEDPRFGWIEVYDHFHHPPATIIERITLPTFDKLLRHTGPTIEGFDRSAVFRNLGGWLAEYHQIDMSELEVRDASADQVISGMLKLVDIIIKSKTWPKLTMSLRDVIQHKAGRILPAELPLGLGHGDFAPRNVFIGPGSRVTVIDSLGRYAAPIYEDLAYLLVELLTGAVRIRQKGLPVSMNELAKMRSELLSGYGMPDDEVLCIFELRALLDKWRSLAQRSRSKDARGRVASLVDTLRRLIVSRRVKTIIQQLNYHKSC